jgi:hypothetical protein
MPLNLMIYSPKFSARVIAASLPLGSIRACIKSKILTLYPALNVAVVPGVIDAFSLTVK